LNSLGRTKVALRTAKDGLLKKKLYFGGSKVSGWVYNTAEAGAMENSGQYSSGQQK
jgi:hypothetical protein